MPTVSYPAVLRENTEALLAATRRDLDQPIPTCPGWDARRLVRHVARILNATAVHVPRGTVSPPPAAPAAPTDDAALLEFLAEGLAGALLALDAAGEDLPAWNPWPATPRVAGFWRRRLAQEVTVHRYDVENAFGARYEPPPPLAADGVDELLGVFLPLARATAHANGTPQPDGTVHIHLTDVAGEWLVRLDGPAVTVTPGHAKGDAVLRGPAATVLLALWGRYPLDSPGLAVIGEKSLAAAISSGA